MAGEEKKEWFGQQFGWAIREDQIAQPHESMRKMVHRAHGKPYYALRSLEEAKPYPDGIVVIQGDYGGTIYVVCPASLVTCNQETLEQLLSDLDTMAWNDSRGANVYYERQPIGTGVAGGMGGGRVTGDIWVHDEFVQGKVDSAIRAVIRGEIPCLPDEMRSKPLPGWQGTPMPTRDV